MISMIIENYIGWPIMMDNFHLKGDLLTQENIAAPTDFSPCRWYLKLQQNHAGMDNNGIQARAYFHIERNCKEAYNEYNVV